MREINITLWYHDEENDWSVEVNGRLHAHVSATTVDELVEYALIEVQQALLEPDFRGSNVGGEFAELAFTTREQALFEAETTRSNSSLVHLPN